MSLKATIKTGDWVVATAQNGSAIRGQAMHDMGTTGYAALQIAVNDDARNRTIVRVNVNYWDVRPTHMTGL